MDLESGASPDITHAFPIASTLAVRAGRSGDLK